MFIDKLNDVKELTPGELYVVLQVITDQLIAKSRNLPASREAGRVMKIHLDRIISHSGDLLNEATKPQT